MSDRDTMANNLPRLPPRRPDSHKGDYGRVLVIGGSLGMPGSVALAGMAALRSGAGLVTVATPRTCQPVVAGYEPSYMTVGLDEDCEGRLAASSLEQIIPLASHATVVALGPGLGRSAELDHLIRRLYAMLARPMVVDADGLNALAGDPRILASHDGPRILTPHPGEFVRLLGVGKSTREACIERSVQLAGESAIVVVLKGHRTLVTDGTDRWQATTGNPGMATGGSGDVLTGVITGLVGQGLSPVGAARLGVHIHGLAGDLAARRLGQVAMIASDLLRFLPRAFLTLADSGQ